ncbi:hypothetical protein L210DRAFT_3633533 [Boletus edulis BED1]|uniref:Uncharacterized protein n=1 Tax=Boletus edulis BED1 TaxID=1328754 RepID=A0AAD4G9G9_BOLED|nr:hypothetical protein L210DRAFT_3633533 [Boletus edulis BED1]
MKNRWYLVSGCLGARWQLGAVAERWGEIMSSGCPDTYIYYLEPIWIRFFRLENALSVSQQRLKRIMLGFFKFQIGQIRSAFFKFLRVSIPPVFTLKRFDEADGYRYSLLIGGQCVDETDNGFLRLKPEVGDCKKWMIVPDTLPNVRNVPKPHTRYVGYTGVKLECLNYVQTINRHAVLFVELSNESDGGMAVKEGHSLQGVGENDSGRTGNVERWHNGRCQRDSQQVGTNCRSLRTDQVRTLENDTRTCQTTYVPKLPDGLRNGDESPHVSPRGKEIWTICMDALRASYSEDAQINRQKKRQIADTNELSNEEKTTHLHGHTDDF